MTSKHSTTKRSTYEVITDRIIAQLEKGIVPWHKPWGSRNADGTAALPKNLISGKVYRGINRLLTYSAGYDSQYWLTFKQCKDLGGHVNAGEKGMPIVFWMFGTDKSEDGDGAVENPHSRSWAFARYYTVFNLRQCTIPGLDVTTTNEPARVWNFIPACEQIASAWAERIPVRHGGTKACYWPFLDKIDMPAKVSFDSPEEYYNTLFHEIAHGTGHKTRLSREGIGEGHAFGSQVYSREELVAEMGAAFLAGHTGIEVKTLDNSSAYINSWLAKLRNDKKLVLVAAGQAQKAADMILAAAPSKPADVVTEPDENPVSVPAVISTNPDDYWRCECGKVNEKPVVSCARCGKRFLPSFAHLGSGFWDIDIEPAETEPERKPVSLSSLAPAKSNCPYVTIRTGHGAIVIERKRYLAAMRGLNVISADTIRTGKLHMLVITHSTGRVKGTLRFYNQLDVAQSATRTVFKKWARTERDKLATRRKNLKAIESQQNRDKWLGIRVTWVPRDEERHNRITGIVREFVVNPKTGKLGVLVEDDYSRKHTIWDKTGAFYRVADAPALPGEVKAAGAAAA